MKFVDREQELHALNTILKRNGSQFVTVYGRRRVGKTTLLVEWARRSDVPFIYWVGAREPQAMLLRSFSQTVYQHTHPDELVDAGFTFPTWEMAFREVATVCKKHRLILIVDEFPYAAQSDRGLTSYLQNVWDHVLKETEIVLILAGSQIGMMIDMLGYQAPLYGRMTAQLLVKPLPFYALREFFPKYSAEERVAVYAILGGIPAYLELFDANVNLATNIRRQILSPTSIFQNEPFFLLQDEVREVTNYVAVIRAIGEGAHTLDEITLRSGLQKNHISTYLVRLQDLTFVERQLPATIPQNKRTTRGRYVLTDPYLRFYFRFIAPNRILLEQGLINRLWDKIADQLRAFIGQTIFEELCRNWTMRQGALGHLPFVPDVVGRHWTRHVEIDVVAINWQERHVLLGECKWGADPVSRKVITNLVEDRARQVLDQLEGDWHVHFAFFARAGFTDAAQVAGAAVGALLVTLEQLDRDSMPD